MSRALVTGITGQDGSYMAELLLEKGYIVIGIVRSVELASKSLIHVLKNKVILVEWDMFSQLGIEKIILEHKPNEIYNFAAYSSGAGMFENPVDVGDVNSLAVTRILDAIRNVNEKIKFCQASSREIFGDKPTEVPQTESTNKLPRSPYGAAKLYADAMIVIYRNHYNLFACSAILYNHESPRRKIDFVTRKISHEASRIKLGLSDKLSLGNLNSARDWGFAGDTVNAMWLMLQQNEPDDYIVATGETHTVEDFCEQAFIYLGLDYRRYVKSDVSLSREAETVALIGDFRKLNLKTNWEPKVGFKELVHMMVDADIEFLKSNFKAIKG